MPLTYPKSANQKSHWRYPHFEKQRHREICSKSLFGFVVLAMSLNILGTVKAEVTNNPSSHRVEGERQPLKKTSGQAELKVVVNGLPGATGNLKVALCNSKKDYHRKKDPFRGRTVELRKKGRCEVIFKEIPTGTYAVKVFHDVNKNDELDKAGILRVPQESYGFSNNVNSIFGLPPWRKAAFKVKPGTWRIEINLVVNE